MISVGFRLALGAADRPSKLAQLEADAALIGKPEDAINVFDFEPRRRALRQADFAKP